MGKKEFQGVVKVIMYNLFKRRHFSAWIRKFFPRKNWLFGVPRRVSLDMERIMQQQVERDTDRQKRARL